MWQGQTLSNIFFIKENIQTSIKLNRCRELVELYDILFVNSMCLVVCFAARKLCVEGIIPPLDINSLPMEITDKII